MFDECEWQLVDNEWIFGVKERGIVRAYFAVAYVNFHKGEPCGWAWRITSNQQHGVAGSLIAAVEAAEVELREMLCAI